MLTIMFLICMVVVFVKLFLFGLKAAWSIMSFVLTIVFLPVILLGMLAGGLLYIAFPVLIVIGIISFLLKV